MVHMMGVPLLAAKRGGQTRGLSTCSGMHAGCMRCSYCNSALRPLYPGRRLTAQQQASKLPEPT